MRGLLPRRAAHPGQTLVIFALASLVLLAGTGLVLDSGYNFVQRRSMQSAADAAALAGARLLSNNALSTQVAATVVAVAVQNGVPSSANVRCRYITDANPDGVADCQVGVALPLNVGTITGVRATVSETHGTFMLRAVGIRDSGTGATSAAQVQIASGFPGGAVPFVPCGFETKLVNGGEYSILLTAPIQIGVNKFGLPILEKRVVNDPLTGFATVDPLAYAYDWDGYLLTTPLNLRVGLPKPGPGVDPAPGKPYFLIHGPQLATCGAGSNNFKGLNNTTGTITLPARAGDGSGDPPQPIYVDNGVKAGPTRMRRVPGVLGCEIDQFDGCVMVLPIVDNSGPGGNGNNIVYAGRLWGAFWVKQINANEHGAYLIANYPITATGTTGWTPTYSGPVTIRLIR